MSIEPAKLTLWDQLIEDQKRYENRQNQRIAADSVRGHISEQINALRLEAHKLPTCERRADLLRQIADLYDLFCEMGG